MAKHRKRDRSEEDSEEMDNKSLKDAQKGEDLDRKRARKEKVAGQRSAQAGAGQGSAGKKVARKQGGGVRKET